MSHRPDAEEAAHLQYETEHVNPRNNSVVPYLILLVAVAFVLLLMAFFMQRRMDESVEGLNQSANSFRTIDQLVEDNRALHEEVARLQRELAAADDHSEELADQLAQLQKELDDSQAQRDALERQLAQLQVELNQTRAQLAEFIAPD